MAEFNKIREENKKCYEQEKSLRIKLRSNFFF